MGTFSGEEAAALFERYLHTICGESDRGAVLVAASILDSALETALRKKLVAHGGSDDPLFDSAYAPLRSFSAKIEFAYRLGLIRREARQMLHLFRKLRNDFAHGEGEMRLSDEPIRQRVRAMYEVEPVTHRAIVGTFAEIIEGEGNSIAPDGFLTSERGQREVLNVFFAATAMALRRLEVEIEQTPELK